MSKKRSEGREIVDSIAVNGRTEADVPPKFRRLVPVARPVDPRMKPSARVAEAMDNSLAVRYISMRPRDWEQLTDDELADMVERRECSVEKAKAIKESHKELGLSDADADRWIRRAQVLAGLAELERIWAATYPEGNEPTPLPRTRDRSAPITKKRLHELFRSGNYKHRTEKNASRWFAKFKQSGVWWIQKTRQQIVVDLAGLRQEFEELADEDIARLRVADDL